MLQDRTSEVMKGSAHVQPDHDHGPIAGAILFASTPGMHTQSALLQAIAGFLAVRDDSKNSLIYAPSGQWLEVQLR